MKIIKRLKKRARKLIQIVKRLLIALFVLVLFLGAFKHMLLLQQQNHQPPPQNLSPQEIRAEIQRLELLLQEQEKQPQELQF